MYFFNGEAIKKQVYTCWSREQETSSPVVIGISGQFPNPGTDATSSNDTSLQNRASHTAFGAPDSAAPEPPFQPTNFSPFHPRGRIWSRLSARSAGEKRTMPIICHEGGTREGTRGRGRGGGGNHDHTRYIYLW